MHNKRARISKPNIGLIQTHISNNLKNYVIVTVIFLVGVVLGVLFINNVNNAQSEEISGYINNFIEKTKDNASVDYIRLCMTSLKNNLSLAILLWFAGLTVIGVFVVYIVICFRGFCLGYTISSIVATIGTKNGSLFILSTLLPQNIIFIPTIFAIAISCMRLYKSIMKDKRRENIKIEILRHTVFCALASVLLILASLVETYISTNIFMLIKNIF